MSRQRMRLMLLPVLERKRDASPQPANQQRQCCGAGPKDVVTPHCHLRLSTRMLCSYPQACAVEQENQFSRNPVRDPSPGEMLDRVIRALRAILFCATFCSSAAQSWCHQKRRTMTLFISTMGATSASGRSGTRLSSVNCGVETTSFGVTAARCSHVRNVPTKVRT